MTLGYRVETQKKHIYIYKYIQRERERLYMFSTQRNYRVGFARFDVGPLDAENARTSSRRNAKLMVSYILYICRDREREGEREKEREIRV